MRFLNAFAASLAPILLTVVTQVWAPAARAENPGGSGGGKIIYCRKSPAIGFAKNGYYALDYAIGRDKDSSPWNIAGNDPLEHLHLIQKVFAAHLQAYTTTSYKIPWDLPFARFISDFEKIWQKMPHGYRLQPTADSPKGNLPANCDDIAKARQITTKEGNFYYTDLELQHQLQATGPTQWSAHLVHEMLRLVLSDATEIAAWNRALHAPEFQSKGKEIVNWLYFQSTVLTPVQFMTGQYAPMKSRSCAERVQALVPRLDRLYYELIELNSAGEVEAGFLRTVERKAICQLVRDRAVHFQTIVRQLDQAAAEISLIKKLVGTDTEERRRQEVLRSQGAAASETLGPWQCLDQESKDALVLATEVRARLDYVEKYEGDAVRVAKESCLNNGLR